MRRMAIPFFLLALAVLALPAWAAEPTAFDDVVTGTPGSGGGTRSNDCSPDPSTVVWDTGMYDEFTPPTGCSTAGSAQCFVDALNEGGFPADGRRIADDWISDGRPVTHIKVWARYNQAGWDYKLANPTAIHGFCVKFYEAREIPPWCPDGSRPGEDAIGNIVYDEHATVFAEYDIPPPSLGRQSNYCITLPVPFFPTTGSVYWVSVSGDFDFTVNGTQYFWRMYDGWPYDPYCESAWWDTWSGSEVPWINISVGINMPCWASWNSAFVLYSLYAPPTGACCDEFGNCTVTTQDQCQGSYQGDGTTCDPNPCPANPVEKKSWGGIKNIFNK